ncbi:ABC-type multidrug transport system, ATPase component [Lentimicrobium saccharophilum]|uniref:ABC-type multidrug transport system, ATPase component n=1 Tax=Lentimicrobium saccharophilum TaxID=1678841 RepID=A0A0S7C5H1_9BACT|nr:ABC transporter ATP-binding protein [Lentimicrobium saccharophilum]GAP44079.1 ABC-type multidrug transport system, ATPase component [Lentimicrobium saccharophilum]
MTKEVSIDCENLTKNYASATALAGISFKVSKGEIFGFIGPDGAGKTSLFRILATLLLPDNGTASVEGLDVVKDYRKLRQILGYMPGRFSLYQDLTVAENLQFFAGIFRVNIKENYYLIRDIYEQIAPFANRRAGKLSGGMKQKLALCCALIHKPVVLILDEPTTGVDAVSRHEFWEMLIRLKQEHITILVATPYMDEAVLCDRVALIQHGEIMAIDTPESITRAYPDQLFKIKSNNTLTAIRLMKEFEGILSAEMFGDTVHVSAEKGRINAYAIKEYLSEKGMMVTAVSEADPGIEDCFIHLMKQSGVVKNETIIS